MSSVDHLETICHSLARTEPWHIPSPPECRKRASVAAIFRVVPQGTFAELPAKDLPAAKNKEEFFQLPWVRAGRAEILYIRRTTNPRDPWSGQIAFPGGKREHGETDREAAERETREEIGIDLCTEAFTYIGALDERKVTTRFGRRLILILCPYVYLQLTPETPTPHLSKGEVASLHWCALSHLLTAPRPYAIRVELAPRLLPRSSSSRPSTPANAQANTTGRARSHSNGRTPRSPLANQPTSPPNVFVRLAHTVASWLLGAVRFEAIRLVDTEVPLWGLTLAMSLDLAEHTGLKVRPGRGWPRFDWKDLNFWQRCFGRLLGVRNGEADRALSRYYQALMLAIIFTIITRILAGWILIRTFHRILPILHARLQEARAHTLEN